jgi:DNA mismatch repair protein MutS2
LHKEYKNATKEAKKAIKTNLTKEAHQLLNIAHKKMKNIGFQEHVELLNLKKDDRVKYRNTKGILVSTKGKKAYIESDDGIKLQVLLKDLKRSGNIPKPKQIVKYNSKINIPKPKSGDIRIDLYGQRVQEAIANLDKFISDSLLIGFDEVLVYHGIGTGKLSYAIKIFLEEHPSVKSFEDRLTKSGGYGAKVVKL